jgi:3',5'-cyclic AMP phosphodiesterase CpdA
VRVLQNESGSLASPGSAAQQHNPNTGGIDRNPEVLGRRPDAIVFNGDLADKGESEAYRKPRAGVVPLAARLNAQLIWVMGNHDNRAALRGFSLDEAPSTAALGRVRMIDGLRISPWIPRYPDFLTAI